MQARAVSSEEGKDLPGPNRTNQTKVLPLRLLQLFVPFVLVCIAFSVISIYTVRRFGIQSMVTTAKSGFQPCYEEANSLDRWIRPPSDLLHNMSDNELFWRATLVPKIKKYPFKRVSKIAFMFLTKGPLPLASLWERFFKGHEGLYSIYIHSHPSFHAHFHPLSAFYKRQIPSQV